MSDPDSLWNFQIAKPQVAFYLFPDFNGSIGGVLAEYVQISL